MFFKKPTLLKDPEKFDIDSSIFISSLILVATILSYLSTFGFPFSRYDLFLCCGVGLLFANFTIVTKSALQLNAKIGLDALLITLLFLTIILFSFLPHYVTTIISFVFAIAGFLFFGFVLLSALKSGVLSKFLIWCILPVLLGIWLTGFLYTDGIHHPLYMERLSIGNIHIDQLFHAAISQMIDTYGVVSTGLAGTPYIPYHFGSHFVFGKFSDLLNIPVLKSYNVLYPIFFLPFYFQCSLSLIKDLSRVFFNNFNQLNPGTVFWLLFTILQIGFLPNIGMSTNWAIWDSWVVSESYLFSLFFLFLASSLSLYVFFEIGKNLRNTILVSLLFWVMLMFSGFSKISVMVVAACCYGYAIVRLNKWNYLVILNIIIVVAIAYFILETTTPPPPPKTKAPIDIFAPLHFVKTWTDSSMRSYYVPMVYLFLLIFLIVKLKSLSNEKISNAMDLWKSRKTLDIEILIVAAVVGFGPGALLKIEGGSAYYFVDIQARIALIFLLAWIVGKLSYDREATTTERPAISSYLLRNAFLVLVGVILSFNNVFVKFENFLDKNLEIRGAILGMNPSAAKYYKFGYASIYTYLAGDPEYVDEKISEVLHLPGAMISTDPTYKFYNRLADTTAQIKDKEKFYLDVPRDNPFWKTALHREDAIPFILPALTGIALKNGLPTNHKELKTYGYSIYNDSLRYTGPDLDKEILIVKPITPASIR